MNTKEAVKPSPGAMRAGKGISDRFRKFLPNLPESNAETLALIIDKETASQEMLEALELLVVTTRAYVAEGINGLDAAIWLAKEAIRRAKGEL